MALWIVLMQINDEKTSTHFLWSRHIKDKLLKNNQTKIKYCSALSLPQLNSFLQILKLTEVNILVLITKNWSKTNLNGLQTVLQYY